MGCRRQWMRPALPAYLPAASLGKPCLRSTTELGGLGAGAGAGAGAGLSDALSCARFTACARRYCSFAEKTEWREEEQILKISLIPKKRKAL